MILREAEDAMEPLRRLVGREAVDLVGLFFLGEQDNSLPLLDSCEIILSDDSSVLFTSATDWALQVVPGSWPELPFWCWPHNSWKYHRLDGPVGHHGWQQIIGAGELLNEVGEVSGAVISFGAGEAVLNSGDRIRIEYR